VSGGVVEVAATAMLDLADRRNDEDHRMGDKYSTAGAMGVSSSWLPSNSRQEPDPDPKAEIAAEAETAGATEDGSGAAAKLLMRSSEPESQSSAAQDSSPGPTAASLPLSSCPLSFFCSSSASARASSSVGCHHPHSSSRSTSRSLRAGAGAVAGAHGSGRALWDDDKGLHGDGDAPILGPESQSTSYPLWEVCGGGARPISLSVTDSMSPSSASSSSSSSASAPPPGHRPPPAVPLPLLLLLSSPLPLAARCPWPFPRRDPVFPPPPVGLGARDAAIRRRSVGDSFLSPALGRPSGRSHESRHAVGRGRGRGTGRAVRLLRCHGRDQCGSCSRLRSGRGSKPGDNVMSASVESSRESSSGWSESLFRAFVTNNNDRTGLSKGPGPVQAERDESQIH
jgi:hypothetical protein